MKQEVLRVLRRLRLLALAEAVYGAKVRRRAARANAEFLREMPGVPLPPAGLMVDPYGAADLREYWRSGREVASRISVIAARAFPGSRERPLRVLDWGCGPARVVRHLRADAPFANAEIQGCDCNERAVNWAAASLNGIRFSTSGLKPPLPFAEESFDVVYGISVLTHLSEESHSQWVTELHRVLAKGGLLLLTVHGSHYRNKLLPAEASAFDQGRLVVRGGIEEGKRLFLAFHPKAYVEGLFDGRFEGFALLDGKADSVAGPQDTVVVRKR